MIRRIVAALVAASLAVACATARSSSPSVGKGYQRVTQDWTGSSTSGHFVDPSLSSQSANLWNHYQGIAVLYAEWKTNQPQASDALSRIKAEAAWVKATWPNASTWSSCGTGAMLPALDDVAWTAHAFLVFNEVTGDKFWLTAAKNAIDCSGNRWYDPNWGGLWYNDAKVSKRSYTAELVFDMLRYDELAHVSDYLGDAQYTYQWATTNVAPCGSGVIAGVSSNCLYRSDGGFWDGVGANGNAVLPTTQTSPTPPPADATGTPYQIQLAATLPSWGWSVTFLEGNMMWSVVAAKLNAISPNPAFAAQINATAAFMAAHESYQGGFLDDQDANTDAAAAYFYRTFAEPLLTSANKTKIDAMYAATASGVVAGNWSWDWQLPASCGVWCNQGFGSSADPKAPLAPIANSTMWAVMGGL